MQTEMDFDLGDYRLDMRAKCILNQLNRNPGASFPAIFSRYSELEGFYRFTNNPRVRTEDLTSTYIENTRKMVEENPASDILIIHDTTQVCPTIKGKIIKEFEPLTSRRQHGFLAHFSMAVEFGRNSQKILGLLALFRWTRTRSQVVKNESARWWDQISASVEGFGNKNRFVHLADREGDSYTLFSNLQKYSSRFVIRLCHERCLSNGSKLFETIRLARPITERVIQISKRAPHHYEKANKIHPPRQNRIATLRISGESLVIKRSDAIPQYKGFPDQLTLNIVRVFEENAPDGEKPIEWILCTSDPIRDGKDLEKVVDLYKSRWIIEEFFKALKTGCSLESRLIESAEAWYRAFTLFIPVACNIYNLKAIPSDAPISEMENLLRPSQIALIKHLAESSNRSIKCSQDVVREIAQLGGHIKYTGPPGWLVLSRGFLELLRMEAGWNAARAAICD